MHPVYPLCSGGAPWDSPLVDTQFVCLYADVGQPLRRHGYVSSQRLALALALALALDLALDLSLTLAGVGRAELRLGSEGRRAQSAGSISAAGSRPASACCLEQKLRSEC